MNITLFDGSVKEFENGMNALQIAKALSQGLGKKALAAKINGEVVDLSTIIDKDCSLEILTFDEPEGKKALWHTASHVMAQAVQRLFPDAKLAIGPAIDTGFYYDFDVARPFVAEDLVKIEKEMKRIVAQNIPLERFELSRADALELVKDEPYKAELISELGEGEAISFYKQGDFTDLCAGPHLMSTGKVRAFKLLSIAGAYWRGSEKNKMLTRIYGTAFEKQEELAAYLKHLKEAKERDHNKLGRELKFFTTNDAVGQGLPLMMPKGAKTLQILQRFVEDEEEARGYLPTKTPIMAKSDLYKISGHWDHYRDGMFVIGDEEKGDELLALRPMTCPFQFMIYKAEHHSYRDLPIRYTETSPLFRNEASGEMHGLIRLRQFTLADAHIICTPEQVSQEFKDVMKLLDYIMTALGINEDFTYRFSKWDPGNKEKYIDNPQAWETSQAMMKEILDEIGIEYVEADDEAAFYGPKLDLQFKNVYGKEDTLITIQIDFALADRFEMEYVDSNGAKKRPYVIHRSSIGCYERTLAILIEKYAGALPLWMAPEQVRLLSITDRSIPYLQEWQSKLKAAGVRVKLDSRSEKIGYKIREARTERVPYMVIAGDKETENGTVSLRKRGEGDLGESSADEFFATLLSEIADKKIF
ncbi:MAG: threonine--tRNA ligase [Clostridia bacterium]|jgi:threonyl-tRNA synthetase|nr:threonine--tRNA ligase [Clostridia bacterium]MBT7121519.1 threonine--tRNA ligase [Clostridia bacterium]